MLECIASFSQFRPVFAAGFRGIGLELSRLRQRGFHTRLPHWQCAVEGGSYVMSKLLFIAGLFSMSYLWSPGFAADVDSHMRTLAWKVNSAVDVRPYLPMR